MQNHSNENEFDLHENGREGETHFHMNGFEPRLVLKQRQRVTRKWPITYLVKQTTGGFEKLQLSANFQIKTR